MKGVNLSGDLIVADVLSRWPEAVPVFLDRKMGCVGCAMALFETLSEVAAVYGLNLNDLLTEVQGKIDHRRERE